METIPDLRAYGGADAYLRDCASRTVLAVLANKWTCLVLAALAGRRMRFGELRRRLDGITQKSLTQTLRELERDGLVQRTVFPTMPLRVDYHLTELGRSAARLAWQIQRWSEEHVEEILSARVAYAERQEQERMELATSG